MMKVSNQGLAELAAHEGIVLSPYYDSVGVLTIGIGHTKNAGGLNPASIPFDEELPIEKVMEIFREDIAKFEKRVNDAVKVPLKQHQFDALVSFDYNTGGIHRAKLLKSLNNGDYGKAGRQFMGWSKPPEIIPRREKEMELFLNGDYGNGKATIFKTNGRGKVVWSSGKSVDVLSLMRVNHIPQHSPKPDPKPEVKESFWDLLIEFLLSLFGRK